MRDIVILAPHKEDRAGRDHDEACYARTVVACELDGQTRLVVRHRMTPDHGEVLAWIVSLPTPVRVVYEAGPTGFGLARV